MQSNAAFESFQIIKKSTSTYEDKTFKLVSFHEVISSNIIRSLYILVSIDVIELFFLFFINSLFI